MSSQSFRPTVAKGRMRESRWLVHGPWEQRTFDPMSRVELYRLLHGELVASGALPADSIPPPSNRHHGDVAPTLLRCSWVANKWVLDEPLAAAV